MTESDAVRRYYRAEVEDYTRQYADAFTGYPANSKRLDIILARVAVHRPRTLLDCGCGEGSPMSRLDDAGVQVWGFDFVEEMVQRAKQVLKPKGLQDRVWTGDITDLATFRLAHADAPALYDLTIAMGVFPHLRDEVGAIRNMAAVTRPGGHVLVEFRNELFSLYTLNRYSHQFFLDRLLRVDDVGRRHPEHSAAVVRVAEKLKTFFRLDMPKMRTGSANAPGYDEILSQFRNPFEVDALFERAGLRLSGLYFYHFHALPPIFEHDAPETFRALSLELERHPSDWRGYFMASAFVAEAQKPTESTR